MPLTEPLVCFQCIDKLVPHLYHYKCHSKDKTKFKAIQTNENNMLAASWTFHQQLDGLNVHKGIPLAAISVTSASSHRIASQDNRYSVKLCIEFLYPATCWPRFLLRSKGRGRARTIVPGKQLCTFKTKPLFAECVVGWKYQETMKQWQNHRAFLEQE